MRGQGIRIACVMGLVALVCGGPLVSEENRKAREGAKAPTAAETQAVMEKWQAAATPGQAHKRLDAFAGKWSLTMKAWMGGPGTEPTVSKGTSTVGWILGERFLEERFQGEMAMPGPSGEMVSVPFEGRGLTGYDNFRKMYIGSWVDGTSTQILTMKGSFDPEHRVLTMYGEMDEPAIDTVGRHVKYVSRIADANTRVFEMYDLHAGDDHKVFEITYKKQ